jgi:heat shock 70kDa protein 4
VHSVAYFVVGDADLCFCLCTKVINECSEAENWLREKKQQQDALPKYANPVMLVSDIKKKAETLDRFVTLFPCLSDFTFIRENGCEIFLFRFCKPIMTKPRPAPKSQTPPPQAGTPETPEQPQNSAAAAGEPASEGGAQEPAGEQMETDKPVNSDEAAA